MLNDNNYSNAWGIPHRVNPIPRRKPHSLRRRRRDRRNKGRRSPYNKGRTITPRGLN